MRHKSIICGIVICLVVLFIAFCVMLATPAKAYEGERITTARQDAIHEAADMLRAAGLTDDDPAIMALSAEWWAEQEALDIVARVVQGEAGSCPWEHQVAVAAVVVNRVASPYFPDTVREVVASPGQYTTLYLSGFEQTTRQCYEAAKKALDGESGVPEDVIWQAEFVQGTEIWWISKVDTGWFASTTYFCRGVV
jgi:spore germination cell wall hydrolase CwlJ-like protein